MRAALASLVLLASGCVTPVVVDHSWKPAWKWATVDHLEASAALPDGGGWLTVSCQDTGLYVNGRFAGAPAAGPERQLMLQEVAEGALERDDEVLGAYPVAPHVVDGISG